MIVGDLNVAASQADVHKKYSYDRMYSAAEKEALQALLNDYTDIWRRLHPDADSVFTVWDEKTSARVFNEVNLLQTSPAYPQYTEGCLLASGHIHFRTCHAAEKRDVLCSSSGWLNSGFSVLALLRSVHELVREDVGQQEGAELWDLTVL